jgi:adenylyltransferase/sulfurtransferase
MKIRKDPKNPLNGSNPTQSELIDYDQFCGIGVPSGQEREVNALSVETFKAWQESGKEHVLIDVREPYEYGIAQMGGELIPLASVTESTSRIPRDRPVVVHCRSGVRSAKAIRQLEDEHGYDNLLNLTGGILEWQAQIDSSLARY